MTTIDSESLESSAPDPNRWVPVRIRGRVVRVLCPSWCTSLHDEDLVDLDDVEHCSPRVPLSLPVGGHEEDVLVAWVAEFPHARGVDRGPVLVLDVTGSGETVELRRGDAVAVLGLLAAHVRSLDDLADTLPE